MGQRDEPRGIIRKCRVIVKIDEGRPMDVSRSERGTARRSFYMIMLPRIRKNFDVNLPRPCMCAAITWPSRSIETI